MTRWEVTVVCWMEQKVMLGVDKVCRVSSGHLCMSGYRSGHLCLLVQCPLWWLKRCQQKVSLYYSVQ